MKYLLTIVLALTAVASFGAETPGMRAYHEQNYGAAMRLLKQESARLTKDSAEYFEHFFAYIESLLYNNLIDEAEKELKSVSGSLADTQKNVYDFLTAKIAYMRKNFDVGEKILLSLSSQKNLTSLMKYDISIMLAEIYLASGRAAEAIALLDACSADENVVRHGEFIMKSLLMRALAAGNKLNRIPAEFEYLQKKYPQLQGKLQHFELLIHAINRDLKSYRQLFNRIFPDGKVPSSLIGDTVLYQGALLCEQQAHYEKNPDEIIFHLRNQTRFASNDAYRAESYRNLIEINLKNDRKKDALDSVRSMLASIPTLNDRVKWQMLCGNLQKELKDGDSGLSLFLDIKNNTDLPPSVRAEAAEAAAEVYKLGNRRADLLKIYAFMADFPGETTINDRGLLLTGKYYFEHGEYRLAESVFARIAATSKIYSEALFYLIQCKIANDELVSAMMDIEKLEHLGAENISKSLPDIKFAAVYFRAAVAEAMKKDEEAAALYEKAAEISSDHPAGKIMVVNAWLKAAELQYKRESYSNAGLLFMTFAEKNPDHEKTPEAFYKSVYSYFLADRYDEMKYSINKLEKSFPDHELTVNALFHETDYLKRNDRINDALKILDRIANLKQGKKDSVSAQILYDKALIYYQLNNYKAAFENLELLEKMQNVPQIAEGCFLIGTIYAEQGKNETAAEYFRKAADMRSEKIFKAAAMGRAADNYFIAGTKNKDNASLKKAAEIYGNAVRDTSLPQVFRVQCLYKNGRTLEALSDYQGALDAYTEVLYLDYDDNKDSGKSAVPVWINRSALNAIDIHLRLGGMNALNDSLFIIRRLKKLNTMTDKELEDLEYNVRTRYTQQD